MQKSQSSEYFLTIDSLNIVYFNILLVNQPYLNSFFDLVLEVYRKMASVLVLIYVVLTFN